MEELGIRVLARTYHVGSGTVRQALAPTVPPERKMPVRAAPKLDPFKPVTDAMLRVDLDAPHKQRHTATRIHHRLLDEHDGDESYGSVRDYVRARRPLIEIDAGRRVLQAFVPQVHATGGGGGRFR